MVGPRNLVKTASITTQLEECAQDRTGWRMMAHETKETFAVNRRENINEAVQKKKKKRKRQ